MFPRKFVSASSSKVLKYSPMVKLGDQIYNSVVVRGTTYRSGFLVISKVFSEDLLQVGEILKIVLRKQDVLMVVILSMAARNSLGFFEALPSETVAMVSFKPIIKRGDSYTFPFVLHHHVGPLPLLSMSHERTQNFANIVLPSREPFF
jgi:hypothetical protein